MSLIYSPTTIRTALTSAPESNPNGIGQPGALVELDQKIIKLGTKPLPLRAAHHLIGRGGNRTAIEFLGGPDTHAIEIDTTLGHRYPQEMSIEGLSIYCPNGAKAIGCNAKTVSQVGHLYVEDVFCNGGGIELLGENYFCTLDRVRMYDQPGQAILLEGDGHTFRRLEVFGGKWGKRDPSLPALVEVHGSVALEGFVRIEDSGGRTLLRVTERVPGQEGAVYNNGAWIEPHAKDGETISVPSVSLRNSRWVGETPAQWPPVHPWKAEGNVRVYQPVAKEMPVS
jgi:hypothetical protein